MHLFSEANCSDNIQTCGPPSGPPKPSFLRFSRINLTPHAKKAPITKKTLSLVLRNKPAFNQTAAPPARPRPRVPTRLRERTVRTQRSKSLTSLHEKPLPCSDPLKTARSTAEARAEDHRAQIIQALRFVKTLPPVSVQELKQREVDVPRPADKRRTVVFDLDETLVHCCRPDELADVCIQFKLASGRSVRSGVNVRPFARALLEEAHKLFEVVVFTASDQGYADAVLDYLDPSKELIDLRLYRNSCVFVGGVFLKDLRILRHRELKDTVLVDNLVYSFGNQLSNGVPVMSWYDDQTDEELFKLIGYLKRLAAADDVRTLNDTHFQLKAFPSL